MTSGEHLFRSDIQVAGCRIYIKAKDEIQAKLAETYMARAMRNESQTWSRINSGDTCDHCRGLGYLIIGIDRVRCPKCNKFNRVPCEGGD